MAKINQDDLRKRFDEAMRKFVNDKVKDVRDLAYGVLTTRIAFIGWGSDDNDLTAADLRDMLVKAVDDGINVALKEALDEALNKLKEEEEK